MSKTKLANIFDNLSSISYILFQTDDLIIKIGKKETFTETRKVPAHTSYTPIMIPLLTIPSIKLSLF